MEAEKGFKKRLEEAKNTKEFLKIIFNYPSAGRATIKRGYVKACYSDSFDFEEIYDGHVTYSYDFITEIKTGDNYGKS